MLPNKDATSILRSDELESRRGYELKDGATLSLLAGDCGISMMLVSGG